MGQEVSERSEAGQLLQSHSAFEKGQDERGSSAVRAPPWQSTSRSSLPSATGKFKRNRARAEVRVLTKPQPQRTPSQAAGARRSAGPTGAQPLLPLPLAELSEFLKITPLWCCSPCSSPSPGTPGIRETQPGWARTRPHEALLSQGQGQNSCKPAAWDFNGKIHDMQRPKYLLPAWLRSPAPPQNQHPPMAQGSPQHAGGSSGCGSPRRSRLQRRFPG